MSVPPSQCSGEASRFFPRELFPAGGSSNAPVTCLIPVARPRRRSPAGFSLIEMLVVVAIIGMVATFSILAFGPTSGASALTTSVSQVAGVVSAARQLAVSNNAPTRFFIILEDGPSGSEWKMRGYGILREEVGIGTGSHRMFFLASPLQLLRTGVYFARDAGENTGSAGDNAPNMFDETGSQVISGAIQGGQDVKYAFIEFQPTGAASSATPSNIFRMRRGLNADTPIPNDTNFARIGVAQHTGRVKVERPDAK